MNLRYDRIIRTCNKTDEKERDSRNRRYSYETVSDFRERPIRVGLTDMKTLSRSVRSITYIYVLLWLYFAKHVIWETSPTAHGNNSRETDETVDPRNDIVFMESVFFCSRAWTGSTRLCTLGTIKQSNSLFFSPSSRGLLLTAKWAYKLSIDGDFPPTVFHESVNNILIRHA